METRKYAPEEAKKSSLFSKLRRKAKTIAGVAALAGAVSSAGTARAESNQGDTHKNREASAQIIAERAADDLTSDELKKNAEKYVEFLNGQEIKEIGPVQIHFPKSELIRQGDKYVVQQMNVSLTDGRNFYKFYGFYKAADKDGSLKKMLDKYAAPQGYKPDFHFELAKNTKIGEFKIVGFGDPNLFLDNLELKELIKKFAEQHNLFGKIDVRITPLLQGENVKVRVQIKDEQGNSTEFFGLIPKKEDDTKDEPEYGGNALQSLINFGEIRVGAGQ